MARRWVKLWVSESLRGTIRFDFTPAQRSVWYDLLVLAGDCRQDGLIAPGPDVAYPLNWIAGSLNISRHLLEKTLNICERCSRIQVNGQGIRILNWDKYQSEYERQKPFRHKKVTPKVTQRLPVEGEGDIEGEGEVRNYVKKVTDKKYGEFQNVLLTDTEYQKLKAALTESAAKQLIERLSAYMASKGKHYKSHYATILNWDRKDKQEGKGNVTTNRGIPGNRPAGAFDDLEKGE